MDLGIYQNVIDEWTNERGLADALEALCRYHLSNAEDNGGAWDPEFKHAPFDLLPLEIHAIFQVRQQLGLTAPAVSSPLLSAETAALKTWSPFLINLLSEWKRPTSVSSGFRRRRDPFFS